MQFQICTDGASGETVMQFQICTDGASGEINCHAVPDMYRRGIWRN
jgi:hypothetical protein